MPHLKGDSITFKIDTTEYNMDATSIVFSHSEATSGDPVTFAEAKAGGSYEWKCAITAYQANDATALHKFFWDNTGKDVNFTFAPNGNTTPSATQPHYTGTLSLSGQKPDIGGSAGKGKWSFSITVDVEGDLTRKVS